MTKRTSLVMCATGLAVALTSPGRAHADASCGDHAAVDNLSLRQLAAKVVAWREKNPPRASDPRHWRKVQLLGSNDFHGQLSSRLLGTSPVGGAAVLAGYFSKAAAEAGKDVPTFIIHAGDHVGATPPNSALLQDEPSISVLNLMANNHCGYGLRRLDPRCNVVGTPGNHEFDEGRAELLRLLNGGNHAKGPFLEQPWRGAKVPYVSANVVEASSGRHLLPPFVIKSVGKGVSFGVIGAVLKGTPNIVTPAGVAGLKFLDEAEAINEQIPYLQALGIRAVVVTIHQGGFQTNNTGGGAGPAEALNGPEIKDIVARLDGEVDVVISGHAHSFTNTILPNRAGKPVLVTQSFANSTAYSDIDLEIDPATREVMAKRATVVTTFHKDLAGKDVVTPDPAIAALVAAADARVAPIVSAQVGTSAAPLTRAQNQAGETALGNFIADAQRWKMGTDFAFMNPGGVRADLDAGLVTWGELFVIQPFSNDLVTMRLTGQQVIDLLNQQFVVNRILQISGLSYRWRDADGTGVGVGNGAVGGSLLEVRTAGGAPIDPAASYSVTVNSFLAGGGDGFTVLTGGTQRVVGPVDLDGLVDYVKQLPQPFGATIEGRILFVP